MNTTHVFFPTIAASMSFAGDMRDISDGMADGVRVVNGSREFWIRENRDIADILPPLASAVTTVFHECDRVELERRYLPMVHAKRLAGAVFATFEGAGDEA